MRGRFGNCSIDTETRELRRDGARVDLPPKALQLLEALIEARPAPLSREVLYERLWPGVFVETGNLHTLIAEIRAAIGDGDHQIIRTVHRFGYAFAAELSCDDRPAAILIVGSRTFPLQPGENVIGRDLIGSIDVSRHHARITIAGNSMTIVDLGSKNGTWLGGKRIDSAPLADGDELFFGSTRAVIRRSVNDATVTAVPPV